MKYVGRAQAADKKIKMGKPIHIKGLLFQRGPFYLLFTRIASRPFCTFIEFKKSLFLPSYKISNFFLFLPQPIHPYNTHYDRSSCTPSALFFSRALRFSFSLLWQYRTRTPTSRINVSSPQSIYRAIRGCNIYGAVSCRG